MILLVLQAKYNPFPDLPFAGDYLSTSHLRMAFLHHRQMPDLSAFVLGFL